MTPHLIYTGNVRHRRFLPKLHEFAYQIFMFCFEISDINFVFENIKPVSVGKFNWFYFQRKNYIGDQQISLDQAVRKFINDKTQVYPQGKIYLLTQLTCLGYCFNPLSLYFIFDENDQKLEYLIAEVTNTPWGEKHCYLLTNPVQKHPSAYYYEFAKELHVSPFMNMDFTYHFYLTLNSNHIVVHMENYQNNIKHFDASLTLKANSKIIKTFWRYPLVTYKTSAAIYWQAFILWIKGIRYQPHPRNSKD